VSRTQIDHERITTEWTSQAPRHHVRRPGPSTAGIGTPGCRLERAGGVIGRDEQTDRIAGPAIHGPFVGHGHRAYAAAMPMRIGVQLPEVERVVRWNEVAAMARTADEVGFDAIWVGDHLIYRGDDRPERGPWEAWTQLAALAAITSDIELGPLVACLGFHPPAVMAKMAASIDEVSGGRFVLGIGSGWNRAEFEAFGIPFDRRVERFEVGIAAVAELVHGGRATSRHPLLDLDDAVLLPPSTRPAERRLPIMIGSNGPRMLRAGLPFADRWNTWFVDHGNDPVRFAGIARHVDAIGVEVGRPLGSIEHSSCVLVVSDRARGERRVDDGVRPVRLPNPGASTDDFVDALSSWSHHGADDIVLVADPIDQRTIEHLGTLLPLVRERVAGAG
jgi:alkanesulfonate monooxygenase SsuD/methylene tetrahydromethanopterin reductase-like flavin-dependent oxidoreductase (luciferase family)